MEKRIKFCDRCGEEINHESKEFKFVQTTISKSFFKKNINAEYKNITVQICNRCYDDEFVADINNVLYKIFPHIV